MVSTLLGVNDLPAVRDGQRGVAFNGCPLDDLHQAFWPGLRSIIPDDLVTTLAGLKSLFHQRRHARCLVFSDKVLISPHFFCRATSRRLQVSIQKHLNTGRDKAARVHRNPDYRRVGPFIEK
jgi:hypothetical protein